jgi:signal recognition particle receptor subunit beta
MVFFNYATMQMAAKIVYYGPGLCGKTTNLHYIYSKTSPQSRGEMVSLETETDRTLFFDLLPLDVGVVGGFKTRLQLYTVPGQVFYNTTRKLVLKGADGIVFVADSQRPMLEANVESLKNLRENLAEIGLNLDELPVVIQLNKRDLPNVVEVESMVSALDPEGRHEFVEASAVTGAGVFETLKTISKLTLRMLRKRMMGEEGKPAAPKRPAPRSDASTPVFTVHGSTPAQAPAPPPVIVQPPPEPVEAPAAAAEAVAPAAVAVEESGVPFATTEMKLPPEVAPAPPVQEEAVTAPPVVDEVAPAAAAEAVEAVSEPEPEIVFAEEKSVKPVEPEVKHVKVRSTVDIMAELDQLRKKATQSTPTKSRVDVLSALDALTSTPKPKKQKELTRNLQLEADPSTAQQARRVRVTVSFENDESGVVQQQEQTVELDRSDWASLQLNVKVDLGGSSR